jgi:hypothetical protein
MIFCGYGGQPTEELCHDCDQFPCICDEIDPQDEEDYHTGNVCPVCGDWITGIEIDAAVTIWYAPLPELEVDEYFVHGDCAECTDPKLDPRLLAAIAEAKSKVQG